MSDKRRQKRRMQIVALTCRLMPLLAGMTALICGIVFLVRTTTGSSDTETPVILAEPAATEAEPEVEPIVSASEAFPELDISEQFLTINDYSRSGAKLDKVSKIVIHYTGNPGTTAQGNRDYFESLAENPVTAASSHFVIGLDGEIIQCIPLDEIAFASNEANSYSLSIECCHPDSSGEFTTATYNQCVALTAALCSYYGLDPEEDVIRHYDVTGKECPLYYVKNPEEWEMFIGFVKKKMEASGAL